MKIFVLSYKFTFISFFAPRWHLLGKTFVNNKDRNKILKNINEFSKIITRNMFNDNSQYF